MCVQGKTQANALEVKQRLCVAPSFTSVLVPGYQESGLATENRKKYARLQNLAKLGQFWFVFGHFLPETTKFRPIFQSHPQQMSIYRQFRQFRRLR